MLEKRRQWIGTMHMHTHTLPQGVLHVRAQLSDPQDDKICVVFNHWVYNVCYNSERADTYFVSLHVYFQITMLLSGIPGIRPCWFPSSWSVPLFWIQEDAATDWLAHGPGRIGLRFSPAVCQAWPWTDSASPPILTSMDLLHSFTA